MTEALHTDNKPTEPPFEFATSLEKDGTIAIQTDHGFLLARHEFALGMFMIGRIDVEAAHRRHGIGKALLREAARQAAEQGANEIFASIESRESIDAFTAVFGEDSVNVINLGNYAPDSDPQAHDASAILLHKLKS